jgi:GNAT superfamily N-acetyltransferase
VQRHTLAKPGAVREAIRVHGRAWQEAYEELLPAEVLEAVTVDATSEDVDRWLERLPDGDGVAWGAAVDDTVWGYIFLRWTGTKPFVRADEVGLKEIYVHPEWWGEGVGTTMLRWAVNTVSPDWNGLALETLAGNDRGRAFYESRGFTADGHDQIEIAGDAYETVVYRRRL